MSIQGASASPAFEGAESKRPSPLALSLVREDGDWGAFGDLEAAVGRAAAAFAAHPICRVPPASAASVVLGSDALITRLNRAYRGKDGATNVLSFPYQSPPGALAEGGESGYLGDVVLAAETIHCEAVARGIAPSAHLQHLVVHGLLHLIGCDHRNDAEAEAMESLETAILAEIGVADPHGGSPA